MIEIEESTLSDLRERLARTRFAADIPDIGWRQGTPPDFLRALVDHWQHHYDWRTHEARLNKYPQLVTEVDGQQIHLLHVRSPHPDATPLVLSHGWPGSIVEFLDVIDPLTTPDDPAGAFHLVIPSLPGYGFSGPVTAPGWHPRRIAAAFGEIMNRLGYDRYGAQGGDWGSVISANMADLHPEEVIGLHLNYLALPPPAGEAPLEPTPSAARFAATGSGYMNVQMTKPQSIGALLEDSPAGLAAWIVEKFRDWSDCDGDVLASFTLDQLITNVMLYWVAGTGTSAARLYWEMARAGSAALPQDRITVPTGVANFPAEIAATKREWAERRYDIVHWTEHERGGHFAAMEVPDLFAEDVRSFFRLVR